MADMVNSPPPELLWDLCNALHSTAQIETYPDGSNAPSIVNAAEVVHAILAVLRNHTR